VPNPNNADQESSISRQGLCQCGKTWKPIRPFLPARNRRRQLMPSAPAVQHLARSPRVRSAPSGKLLTVSALFSLLSCQAMVAADSA
jgi:hypothetical protein